MIDFSEMSKRFDDRLRKEYGWWYYPTIWWWNIQDWWYGSTLYDVWWWMTDGKPQWPDADQSQCPRTICCKCGKKPFGKQ